MNVIQSQKRERGHLLLLTGSFLKKTREVRVRINHRFFQDFQPIPAEVQ